MTLKITVGVILVTGVVVGTVMIIYGIKGGIIEKRILANNWTATYLTGTEAVRRGWTYVVLGTLITACMSYLLARAIRELFL